MRLSVINKILLLIIIPFFFVTAQKSQDSLIKQNNPSNEKQKAQTYFEKGKSYEHQNIDSALHFDSLALTSVKTSGSDFLKASILYNIAYNFYILGDNKTSLNNCNKALNIFKKIYFQLGIANSLNLIGVIYQDFGDYDKALKSQLEALQIYDSIKDYSGKILTYNHLGVLYKNLKDYNKSMDYYRSALAILKNHKNDDLLARTQNNIANLYLSENKLQIALNYSLKSLNLKKMIKAGTVELVNSYSTIGTILRGLKHYNEAIIQYNLGLKLADKLGNKNHQSIILKNLGILSSLIGQPQKALAFHKQSIKLAKKINYNRIIIADMKSLSDIYKNLGNYKLSLKYFKEYTQVKDSIFNQDLKNKLDEYSANYERVNKAKILQQLNTDKQRLFSILSVLIAGLILILVIVIYNRYRTKVKTNSELSEKNKILAGVLSEVNKLHKNLSTSEASYRNLFENNPMPMFIISNKELNFLAVNETAIDIYGYSQDEFRKMNFNDLWDASENSNYNKLIQKIVNNPGKIITAKHKRKDNKVMHVEIISHHFLFEGKEALHVMISDESERRLIEQVVQESEERYRNLFEGAPDAIIIADSLTGLILDANPAASRLLQRPLNEIIGLHQTKMHPADKIQYAKESFKRHALSENIGHSSAIEIDILRPDFTTVPVEISGKLISVGGRQAVQGILRDISHKKKTEESIKQSEQRLRKAQRIANVGFWELDLKTKIIIGSVESAEMYGLFPNDGQIKYQIIKALALPEYRETLDKSLNDLVNEGKEYDVQYKIKRRDTGEIRILHAKAELIKDENNNPEKILGALHDVTELQTYQEQLINAREVAEKSDRLKSEFLAQMSHEIRSPVNIIMSFSTLIKDEMNSGMNEDMKVCFNAIDSGGKRLIRTIDLILNMADLQSGKYESYFEQTDLENDILSDLLPGYISDAKKNNLKIEFISEPDIKPLFIDRYSVSQILANLIDNAIKYTKQGGVLIKLVNSPNSVDIIIKDTGIGISEDFLPYIFDPFSQEEQGYTRRFEGTGLGLALVKKYCDVNMSSLKVKTKKGAGTTFTVSIPTTTENMYLANYSNV